MNIPSSHYALLFDYYQFPKKSAKVKQALLKKLNVGSINYNLMTWNKILTEWEANIEKLFINDLESFVESQFSKPDVDLFFHKAEIKRKDLPTDDEYSVILDHLELTKMSKESPKLWATIALEFDKRDGKFWKEVMLFSFHLNIYLI